MEVQMKRMKELVARLSEAAKAYYQESREIMPNIEYDRLYDELLALEKETGTVLSGSPTQNVGYEVLSELPKEAHESRMLSLDKTKDVGALVSWIGDQKALLSWKLDGLTVVLSYEDGSLRKAVTRGNGEIGEVITGNAHAFQNVPLIIPFRGRLVLRGEAIIRYSDFRRINESIPETSARYKNPRNLCSGSVRQLDPAITRERSVFFYAFSLVTAEETDFHNSRAAQFDFLASQGFEVVEHRLVTAETLPGAVQDFEAKMPDNDFPSDGLVLLLEDIAYGQSLGTTAKFPRNAIAFKWSDETAETTLTCIEWSPSRTGLINPVAVFQPVELEGTTVSRASVHNVSILKGLKLGLGDRITVYKANMIIPQIAENLTGSGTCLPPDVCPVCGQKTEIRRENDTETLWCPNPSCAIKRLKSFALLASRDALNIDGLSEATLEKLIGAGLVHEAADLFRLQEKRDQIASMEGFGEKSADNLLAALDRAKSTETDRLIYALGIPGIGLQNAKVLSRRYQGDFAAFRSAPEEELCGIEGIGTVLAQSIRAFFDDDAQNQRTDALLSVLELKSGTGLSGTGEGDTAPEQVLAGKTFVITGSVEHFENREALKRYIEARGGKASGSVSKKTSFLINNDRSSGSSKNRKAAELGVPVITEEEFLSLAEGSGDDT